MFNVVLAINGHKQSRGAILATKSPRLTLFALPLVLLPLVGGVVYPNPIRIKECFAAFAVCGVSDFVIEWYYVDHGLYDNLFAWKFLASSKYRNGP